MIFPQTRSSFSVSYLSRGTSLHPVPQLRNRRVVLYTSIFLTAPPNPSRDSGFYPCNISNLPVYLHLCCLHPSPDASVLPGLMFSNWAVSNRSACTRQQSDVFKMHIPPPPLPLPCVKLCPMIFGTWRVGRDHHQNWKAPHAVSCSPLGPLSFLCCGQMQLPFFW